MSLVESDEYIFSKVFKKELKQELLSASSFQHCFIWSDIHKETYTGVGRRSPLDNIALWVNKSTLFYFQLSWDNLKHFSIYKIFFLYTSIPFVVKCQFENECTIIQNPRILSIKRNWFMFMIILFNSTNVMLPWILMIVFEFSSFVKIFKHWL